MFIGRLVVNKSAHQNVPHVVHLELESLPDPPYRVIRGRIPHRVIKSGDADPKSVESVIRAVDGQDRGPCVRLRYPPVPLEDNDLGPDLVIDVVPLGNDFLDVILETKDSN